MAKEITRKRGYGTPEVAEVVTGISIGVPEHAPEIVIPKNVYIVTITFMEGDADGYPTHEIQFQPGDEQYIIELLNFCAQCTVTYPSGKGGYEDYSHVYGYNIWVDVDSDEEEDPDDAYPAELAGPYAGCVEWAYNCDYDSYASFESASVIWCNENGDRQYVDIQVQ